VKDTEYRVAIWDESWENLFQGNDKPQGTANLVDNHVTLEIPFGRMLGDVGVLLVGDEQEPTEVDWLYGFSQDGYRIALKNARSMGTSSSSPGGDNQHIGADYLFAAKSPFDPEKPVTNAVVRYSGLEGWVASTPFRSVHDNGTGRLVVVEYDLEHEGAYNVDLLDDDRYHIYVCHSYRYGGLGVEGIDIDHWCEICIDFKTKSSLDDAMDVITSISRFLAVCLGFGSEILEINLRFGNVAGYAKCHSSFFRFKGPDKWNLLRIPFKLPVLAGEIKEYLGAWLLEEGDLQVASGVFASLIGNNWEMPLDLKFLAASQVLEALSRVGVDLASIPQDEYEEYKNAVKEATEGTDAGKWILERLPGNTKGQGRLLRELCDKHQVLFGWLISDGKEFLDNQSSARNHYAHRKPTDKGRAPMQGEELYWHTECVLFLAHGIIWSNLGMDEQAFIDALERSGYRHDEVSKVRSMYSAIA